MTEHDCDNKDQQILQTLQKFQPAGPSMELRQRILNAAAHKKVHWIRYTAVAAAACVLIAVGGYFLLDRDANVETTAKPKEVQLTFAEIQRQISESARAARLLAATDILAKHSSSQQIVKDQYSYIIETYPKTTAGIEAKSRIQSYHQ